MSEQSMTSYRLAGQDFRRARMAASLEQVLARLRGKSNVLLSYDEVVQKLHAVQSTPRGLREIPLDSIIGSVGRYADFTRSFLPKRDSYEGRWARVMVAANSLVGLPPIEVYQVGEAYFVRDGNHRVSVARQMGLDVIEAYVTEVDTKVPITPDTDIDDLILKAEYVGFLETTQLDELRPESDLSVTAPGKFDMLLEHIDVHRYYMGLDFQRDISYQEAVTHWYDAVYLPVAQVIRARGLLRDFPDRTETDLYLWIMEHQAELQKGLGWPVEPEEAADRLAANRSSRPPRVVARLGERLLDAVTPDSLEGGPRPGAWREDWLEPGGYDRLFRHILVPISGEHNSWQAVELAIEVAHREGGQLRGLHVVPEESQLVSASALAIQAEFDQRCQQAGVPGHLAIETGDITRILADRSNWAGLVIAKLNHPPQLRPLATLSCGFCTLLRRSARPVLAVPRQSCCLDSALLAYDGSLKAREALFVATYLASAWRIPLSVLVVQTPDRPADPILSEASRYLESRQTEATLVVRTGDVAGAILQTPREHDHKLIIMGGYGHSPVVEAVMGSAVNQVLRESQRPVLICR